MIKGECFTFLDDFKRTTWPEIFAEVPKKGDWVESKSGKKLKVIDIIHCEERLKEPTTSGHYYIPFIKIELNLPGYFGINREEIK